MYKRTSNEQLPMTRKVRLDKSWGLYIEFVEESQSQQMFVSYPLSPRCFDM